MSRVVSTICHMCNNGCGMRVWVENDKVIKVAGDPDHPVSLGTLCPKGLATTQLQYHSQRLLHPMIRKGDRGEGKWERIPLEAALNIAAERLTKVKEQYGAPSICYTRGAAPAWETDWWFAQRFMSILGSPNIATASNLCHVPGVLANIYVSGNKTLPDFEHTKLIILWAVNPADTLLIFARRILDAKERGAKITVIDSRFSKMAAKADCFIQPRPGSDGALALGMMNVIISEQLYDKDFVEKWTKGFDQLEKLVKEYPPQRVESITWVPADKIVELARDYATTKPACMVDDNGLDMHTNVVQTFRSTTMLKALTGNLGRRGGNLVIPELMLTPITAKDKLPKQVKSVTQCPMFHQLWYLSTSEAYDAILSEKPYPIKAMIVLGGEPVMSTPNSNRGREALKKLDFLLVHELFMTATAELADIIIPAANFLEREALFVYRDRRRPVGANMIGLQRKVIEPLGECISNEDLRIKLAQKMGLPEYFPWPNLKGAIDELLKRINYSYDQLAQQGIYVMKINEAELDRSYEKTGFNTPSRKVEFYSSTFLANGYDPLPDFKEPAESPYSTPDLYREYPLICGTGNKKILWTHFQFRNLPWLAEIEPEPYVEIHPQTAAELGIENGEYVMVESIRDRIKVRVRITRATMPRVVFVTPGWGQPYLKAETAAVNLLPDDSKRCPVSGATGARSFLCRIKKL